MDIISKHTGVFKIETIGDAYVATAGLESKFQSAEENATKIAKFALLVHHFSKHVTILDSNESVVLRIGIHIGDLVTGVVGELNPRFCLFGKTVNKASRLESTGEGGRIHTSMELHIVY